MDGTGHDNAAGSVGHDGLRCLPGPQLPDGVAPVSLLVIRCRERDVTLSLELTADLAVKGLQVRLDGQEHVGSLGEAPAKND